MARRAILSKYPTIGVRRSMAPSRKPLNEALNVSGLFVTSDLGVVGNNRVAVDQSRPTS